MKFQAGFVIVAGLALAPFAAHGADSSFTDLLARAHAEADAGKQWSPRGDNVIETLMSMMPLLPQATPQQITDFESLVHRQQNSLGDEQGNGAAPLQSQPTSQSAAATPAGPGSDGSAEPAKPPSAAGAGTAAGPARTDEPGRKVAAAPPRKPAAPTRTATLAVSPNTVRPGADVGPGTPPEAAKPSGGGNAKSAATPRDANRPISAAEKLDADMYNRGRQAEALGDIATARRYYQTAAEDNYREAASALGRLYDPDWLRQHTTGGIQPNPQVAQQWYDRANALANDNGRQPPNAFSER